MFTVNTSADSAGDGAVVAFEVITATDAALTTAVKRVGTSLPIAEAALAANRPAIIVEINRDTENFDATAQRYLGARYTVTVESLTAGTFTCNVLLDPADMRHFPVGTST